MIWTGLKAELVENSRLPLHLPPENIYSIIYFLSIFLQQGCTFYSTKAPQAYPPVVEVYFH